MMRSSIFGSEVESLLKLCSSAMHIYQIHASMLSRSLDHDNILLSRLIAACSFVGLSDYGYSLFKHKSQPDDIYLYNNMIKSLSVHHSCIKEAIVLYNKIQLAGLRPDSYSFPFVLKAAVRLCDNDTGRQVHGQAIRVGFERDVHVATALVQMYSSGRMVCDARKVFDAVTDRDVVLWNAMVAGYVSNRDMVSARKVFEVIPETNVISWTTLICGYVDVNRPSDAIGIFRRMQLKGMMPDEIAILAALSACADLGALQLGEWIHNYIDKHGLHKTVSLDNALIDMYAKSGNIGMAFEIFVNMEHRSVVSWTTMIAGFALHGLGREALEMFFLMEKAKVKPNEITFISILSACGHVGLVELGRFCFDSMGLGYGITPKIEHYGCMVDLLGRAGHLKEAEDLVLKMPFEANAAIWGSLLAAARTHGNSELAVRALGHLSSMEPGNSGNYALVWNTYAALGKWNEAGMVKKLMRDSGVKKMPGGSSIEINNVIHDFTSADISHPEGKKVYDVLRWLNRQSKVAVYEEMLYELGEKSTVK